MSFYVKKIFTGKLIDHKSAADVAAAREIARAVMPSLVVDFSDRIPAEWWDADLTEDEICAVLYAAPRVEDRERAARRLQPDTARSIAVGNLPAHTHSGEAVWPPASVGACIRSIGVNAIPMDPTQVKGPLRWALEVRQAIGSLGKFEDIRRALVRAGLLDPQCREQTWYKYTNNGSRKAVREAGLVADIVRRAAYTLGAEWKDFPRASWCATWRRTVKSYEAEWAGEEVADSYLDYLQSLPT